MDVGRSIMRSCGHGFLPHVLTRDSTIVDFGVHKGDIAGDLISGFSCRVFGAKSLIVRVTKIYIFENLLLNMRLNVPG